MDETDDIELLRQYADAQSDAAFETLVERYVNLVYSAAWRQVHNPHQAEEITQAVFIILAQKARSLRPGTILSGWLYQTARFTAANHLRTEIRRAHREKEAHMQSVLNESDAVAWPQIAPWLEQAVGGLGEKDRNAIVLRYFERKSLSEVGRAFGTSEDAAKMRVNRALEKLRKFFTKRGITLSITVLAGAVSAHAVQAAPMGLATTVAATAVKGSAVAIPALTLAKGTLKLMAWTKAKLAIAATVVVALAAGTATLAVKEIAAPKLEPWQKEYDLLVTDRVPPQAKVLPSPSTRAWQNIAGSHDGKLLGLGKNFTEVMLAAHGWQFNGGQLIFTVPVPEGRYDFISNLPRGQTIALQQEIKKKFGLVARRETMETNVLSLEVRSANAAGLRRNSGDGISFVAGRGSLTSHNQSIFSLVEYLRQNLDIMVLNRTRIKDNLDIDLKWDSTPEGLKQALLDQLGLELVPGNEFVEFLVVEKAQP
jgi:uncharacterized protein (TIGR03435 family)